MAVSSDISLLDSCQGIDVLVHHMAGPSIYHVYTECKEELLQGQRNSRSHYASNVLDGLAGSSKPMKVSNLRDDSICLSPVSTRIGRPIASSFPRTLSLSWLVCIEFRDPSPKGHFQSELRDSPSAVRRT